jgi:hypothetical protein
MILQYKVLYRICGVILPQSPEKVAVSYTVIFSGAWAKMTPENLYLAILWNSRGLEVWRVVSALYCRGTGIRGF